MQFVVAQYDGSIRYTDDCLRSFVAKLRSAGLWERTIAMITADHGEELHDHGLWGHGRTLKPETLQIPLLLCIPGRRPARSGVWASQVDFLPTLLAASNLPVPPSLAGGDLLSSSDRGHHYAELAWLPVGERNLTPDWMTRGVFVSLTWGEWHYEHVWRDGRESCNLYHLSKLTVVEDKSRAEAARTVLAERYESAIGALLRDAAMEPTVDVEAEKEHIETLRDLGYM